MDTPLTPYTIAQAVCDRLTAHRAAARIVCGPRGEGAMVLLDPLVLVPDPPAAVRFDRPQGRGNREREWVRLDLGDRMARLPDAAVEILAHHRTAQSPI
ncbi:hypothetical protein J0910_30980 [Nocardiopsis sp. CNT-189]|uniref:hypothetical protein n=1 Tax=Nocardiopsis oceanisediminis TaxID=2816862 RepID=UPI003B3453F3